MIIVLCVIIMQGPTLSHTCRLLFVTMASRSFSFFGLDLMSFDPRTSVDLEGIGSGAYAGEKLVMKLEEVLVYKFAPMRALRMRVRVFSMTGRRQPGGRCVIRRLVFRSCGCQIIHWRRR